MTRRVRALAVLLVIASFATSCSASARSKGSTVHFRSEDGFELEGSIFGDGRKGVVLSHMFEGDQSDWFGFARELSDDGYMALVFNFRGYGHSEGTRRIEAIDRDVAGAISFMRKTKNVDSLVLVGASMGAAASLIAASRERVDGVACLSAPASFKGLDAAGVVRDVTPPKLFVASTGDESGASSDAKELFRRAADPSSDLKLVPGDAHGTDMLKGEDSQEVRRVLRQFIAGRSS